MFVRLRSGLEKMQEYNHASYTRQPMSSTIVVDFDSFEKNTELRLQEDSNVIVHISRIPLKTGILW